MHAPSTPRPARPGRAFAIFLSVACALLAVETVVLALQNRRLKEALAAQPAPREEAPRRPRLQVGEVIEPFTLKRGDGALETIAFAGDVHRTLLLVFAETCPACPIVMPAWARLAPAAAAGSTRVVGIRLDPRRDESEPQTTAGFPVFELHDAREVPLDKLATVPLTALVDEWGTVLWVRYGELGEEQIAEILAEVSGG